MLRYLTAGESHGTALTAVLDGFPAGVAVSEDFIAEQLESRRSVLGRGGRAAGEKDRFSIEGGMSGDVTTGAPVALRIENRGGKFSSSPVARPGHADFAACMKYGLEDAALVRERASARETAARVAVGCFAMRLLAENGIMAVGRTLSIGDVNDWSVFPREAERARQAVLSNRARAISCDAGEAMAVAVEAAARKGDTLGGIFEVAVYGVPPGLGSHVQWDRRLDGLLAQSFMSLNGVKSVEVGRGRALASSCGSACVDEFSLSGGRIVRKSNHCGGIEGGVSNGSLILVRAAMKPIPGTAGPRASVNIKKRKAEMSVSATSDICAVPAASVIGESLAALVIAGALLEKFGGDSLPEIRERVAAWRKKTA